MSNRFKPKFNIKKGDTVVVISGDDKDAKKPRKVLEVFPDKSRVLVEGVNIVTRHTKPSASNTRGGIVKKEASIHISNVMIICPGCGQPTRVGNNILSDGKKIRVCRSCNSSLDK